MERAALRKLEEYERRLDPYLARVVLIGTIAILGALGLALFILVGSGVWALLHY